MTLVVMAAGLGSRYGSFKQIESVGKNGELIMDFSIKDACKAGFDKFIFIINSKIASEFKTLIQKNKPTGVEYCFVNQDDPKYLYGFKWPNNRKKPLGTAHAVLAAKDFIDENFAVINADDYYGDEAFTLIYKFLKTPTNPDGISHFCMAGYKLINTLTPNGCVARGICEADKNGFLKEIVEQTKIKTVGKKVKYLNGKDWVEIPGDLTVSLNCFGFDTGILREIETEFGGFMNKVDSDPLNLEFFLPTVVDNMLKKGLCDVKVLKTNGHWYGVTYKEDLPFIKKYFANLS